MAQTLRSSDQMERSTSAGGAAEGSQGQARSEAERAAPGSAVNRRVRPEGAPEVFAQRVRSRVALYRPFRARILDSSIPGAARSTSLRACPWLPSAAPPALVAWST